LHAGQKPACNPKREKLHTRLPIDVAWAIVGVALGREGVKVHLDNPYGYISQQQRLGDLDSHINALFEGKAL
jgi:hypothetical protein